MNRHDPNNKACRWFDWKQRNYTFPPEPCTCPASPPFTEKELKQQIESIRLFEESRSACGYGGEVVSHDRNNKDCPLHRKLVDEFFNWDSCTCPPAGSASIDWEGIKIITPAVDEVEQIRATLDITSATDRANHEIALSLLRIVEQLRAENQKLHDALLPGEYNHLEINDELRAELAAADNKIAIDRITMDNFLRQIATKDAEIERLRERIELQNRSLLRADSTLKDVRLLNEELTLWKKYASPETIANVMREQPND